MKRRKEFGPSQSQQMMRGLTEAVKQIAAEEKVKQVQLKLFETLKTEDVRKTQ